MSNLYDDDNATWAEQQACYVQGSGRVSISTISSRRSRMWARVSTVSCRAGCAY